MRSAMRLMPLLLACLMMGQAMAARNLLAGGSWDPAKKQFVQIAVTFKGKCSDVDAAKLLRDNAVADVKAYFIAQKKTSVADSVVGRLDTACEDMKVCLVSSQPTSPMSTVDISQQALCIVSKQSSSCATE